MVRKIHHKIKKKIKNDLFGFYLGVTLFIIFIGLWYFSSLNIEPQPQFPNQSFEELSPSEQLNEVQDEISSTLDDSNYIRAQMTENNAFCELIVNVSLKEKCMNEFTEYEELIQDTRTESDIMDDSNYIRASMTSDSSYCNIIINDEKKANCIEELSSNQNSESDNQDSNNNDPNYYNIFETGDTYYYDSYENQVGIIFEDSLYEEENN